MKRRRLLRAGALALAAQPPVRVAQAPPRSARVRRGGAMAECILGGAKPVDMPFECATRLEPVVNLMAARALGIAAPNSILLGASEIIE